MTDTANECVYTAVIAKMCMKPFFEKINSQTCFEIWIACLELQTLVYSDPTIA